MASDTISYYSILGVSKDATGSEIKSAYRRLSLMYHPDKNPDNEMASKKFQDLTEAYTVLKDPETRARYDSGTLDIDAWADDADFSRYTSNARTFHDIFTMLFTRMFQRDGPDSYYFDFDDESYYTEDECDDEEDEEYEDDYEPENEEKTLPNECHVTADTQLQPPDQLKKPKCSLHPSGDVLISWRYNTNPKKPVSEFELEMRNDKQNPSTWQLIYRGAKQSVKVSGLDPGTVYRFRVRGRNSAGAGLPSVDTAITTPKATNLVTSSNEQHGKLSSNTCVLCGKNTCSSHDETGDSLRGETPDQSRLSNTKSSKTKVIPPQCGQKAHVSTSQSQSANGNNKSPTTKNAKKTDQAAANRAKVQKLQAEMEDALSRKSKSRAVAVLREAKKTGITLRKELVQKANELIAEAQAQSERQKTINSLLTRMNNATTLDRKQLEELIEEVNQFLERHPPSTKLLQPSLVKVQVTLERFKQTDEVVKRIDDAIKAKNITELEQSIKLAQSLGVNVKEAKKALKSICKHIEIRQQLQAALNDCTTNSLLDVLAIYGSHNYKDSDVNNLLSTCRSTLIELLVKDLNNAVQNKNIERVNDIMKRAKTAGIALDKDIPATLAEALTRLTVDELRAELELALQHKWPPHDRPKVLQTAIEKAIQSPHSHLFKAEIDALQCELERCVIEESVRDQLLQAQGSGNKRALQAALEAATSGNYPNLKAEIQACKEELARIISAERKQSSTRSTKPTVSSRIAASSSTTPAKLTPAKVATQSQATGQSQMSATKPHTVPLKPKDTPIPVILDDENFPPVSLAARGTNTRASTTSPQKNPPSKMQAKRSQTDGSTSEKQNSSTPNSSNSESLVQSTKTHIDNREQPPSTPKSSVDDESFEFDIVSQLEKIYNDGSIHDALGDESLSLEPPHLTQAPWQFAMTTPGLFMYSSPSSSSSSDSTQFYSPFATPIVVPAQYVSETESVYTSQQSLFASNTLFMPPSGANPEVESKPIHTEMPQGPSWQSHTDSQRQPSAPGMGWMSPFGGMLY